MLKSKGMAISLVALLALALVASMLPMSAGAATCTITFNDARVFLEDESDAYQDIDIWIDDVKYTAQPFDYVFTVCNTYDIKINSTKVHGDRLYRHMTALNTIFAQWGWNTQGPIDIDLVNQQNGHLIFHFHCTSAGTGSVEPKYARAGPTMDVLRMPVIRHPDAALIAMQTGTADVWSNLASPMDLYWHKLGEINGGPIRPGVIIKLDGDGFTVTGEAGFHIGHIGYNIRPLDIQWWRRPWPSLTYWPLEDVEFRHALFHLFNQQVILAAIFAWTVNSINDLVPPAHGGWMSQNVKEHPYNPGNPFTSTPNDGTSCGMLKAANYTFADAGTIGVVDSADYWKCPNGDPVPYMELWTPTYETAPTSAEIGARFVDDLGKVGLAAKAENGNSGFEHKPREFAAYKHEVEQSNFDSYMLFWNLHRFPDHLYDMCHGSQDAWRYPGRNNLPGINCKQHQTKLDNLLETLMTSLSHSDKLQAAWEAQERQYDPDWDDQALAYMPLYSKIYWSAFHWDLRGIVKSPGFGAHNKWTLFNLR